MGRVISKILVAVIIPDEPPLEYLVDWVAGEKKVAPKIRRGLRKALANFKAYVRKLADPGRKALQAWFNPDYLTKTGLTYKQVMLMTKAHERAGYKKFQKKIKRAFKKVGRKEMKYFLDAIDFRAYQACLRIARLNLAFGGYGNLIRGVGPFAARWLSGDETVRYLIIDQDNLILDNPIMITRANLTPQFRNKFNSRMHQAGARILKSSYRAIRGENDLTNQLVNQYIRAGLVPFSTGGPSHIDFVIMGEKLFLEIQVSTM